MNSWEANFLPT